MSSVIDDNQYNKLQRQIGVVLYTKMFVETDEVQDFVQLKILRTKELPDFTHLFLLSGLRSLMTFEKILAWLSDFANEFETS